MTPTILKALSQGIDIYLCDECATKAGGVWPREHVATWHVGNCVECAREDVSICALSDWNWPGRRTTLEREF